MNKSDIIESLYRRGYSRGSEDKLSKEEIKAVVNAIFNCIGREVSMGARTEIRGFGAFALRKTSAGKRRNPRYNTSFDSGESYRVYFRPSSKLNALLNKD